MRAAALNESFGVNIIRPPIRVPEMNLRCDVHYWLNARRSWRVHIGGSHRCEGTLSSMTRTVAVQMTAIGETPFWQYFVFVKALRGMCSRLNEIVNRFRSVPPAASGLGG